MLSLLHRSVFIRPFYRAMTVPFASRRLAHGEKEPYTEDPNGFLFNEKVSEGCPSRHYSTAITKVLTGSATILDTKEDYHSQKASF